MFCLITCKFNEALLSFCAFFVLYPEVSTQLLHKLLEVLISAVSKMVPNHILKSNFILKKIRVQVLFSLINLNLFCETVFAVSLEVMLFLTQSYFKIIQIL